MTLSYKRLFSNYFKKFNKDIPITSSIKKQESNKSDLRIKKCNFYKIKIKYEREKL